jgi:hypothetical protein
VALGIDWMLVGLDALTRQPSSLLAVCDLFARPGHAGAENQNIGVS